MCILVIILLVVALIVTLIVVLSLKHWSVHPMLHSSWSVTGLREALHLSLLCCTLWAPKHQWIPLMTVFNINISLHTCIKILEIVHVLHGFIYDNDLNCGFILPSFTWFSFREQEFIFEYLPAYSILSPWRALLWYMIQAVDVLKIFISGLCLHFQIVCLWFPCH